MKKERVILCAILLIGIFLRLYKLGDIPVGFHRDEAFLGYNAYSLLKTGRDMAGTFLPLHLKAYLYSPAGYSYASIPAILLLGLTPFSARFASAFFGVLSVLLVYLVTKKMFPGKIAGSIAPVASILFAISPWHINLTRTVTENSIVVFFVLTGVYLYIRWHETGKLYLAFLSFFSFFVTLYLYQAPRVFLPLFIPLLMYYCSKPGRINNLIRPVQIALYVGLLIPVVLVFLNTTLSLRVRTVSLFASPETTLVTEEQLREDGVTHVPILLTRMFHNKPSGYTQQFLQNYFSHFTYSFLFTDLGKPDRYRVPGSGLMYLFELPFLLLGMYYVLKTHSRLSVLLFGWVLLTPVGSALAHDDIPNLQRTLIMLPALSIFTATGFLCAATKIKRSYRLLFYAVIIFTGGYFFSLYVHNYYVHQIRRLPLYRQEGYRDLVAGVNRNLPDYQKAVITNRESAPAIFFLFFGAYDPALYQTEIASKTGLDFSLFNFGIYEFSTEECPFRDYVDPDTGKESSTGIPGVIYVNYGTCRIPKDAKVLSVITRSDGSDVFRVLEAGVATQ